MEALGPRFRRVLSCPALLRGASSGAPLPAACGGERARGRRRASPQGFPAALRPPGRPQRDAQAEAKEAILAPGAAGKPARGRSPLDRTAPADCRLQGRSRTGLGSLKSAGPGGVQAQAQA